MYFNKRLRVHDIFIMPIRVCRNVVRHHHRVRARYNIVGAVVRGKKIKKKSRAFTLVPATGDDIYRPPMRVIRRAYRVRPETLCNRYEYAREVQASRRDVIFTFSGRVDPPGVCPAISSGRGIGSTWFGVEGKKANLYTNTSKNKCATRVDRTRVSSAYARI